jgi:hypothetical protein
MLEVWQLMEGDLVLIEGEECEITHNVESGTEETCEVRYFNHATNMVERKDIQWDLGLETWGY